jgi:hypothetical protein
MRELRKLHNEGFHNSYFSQNIIRIIKSMKVKFGRVRNTHNIKEDFGRKI